MNRNKCERKWNVGDLLLTFFGGIKRIVCEEYGDGKTIYETYYLTDNDFEFNGIIIKINNYWLIQA